MIVDLIIDPAAIPKGQALKCDAEIRIGKSKLKIPMVAKRFIQNTQTSLGHQKAYMTVRHLLTALALSAESQQESKGLAVAKDGAEGTEQ